MQTLCRYRPNTHKRNHAPKRPNRETGRIVEKLGTYPPRFPCYPVFEITRFGHGAFAENVRFLPEKTIGQRARISRFCLAVSPVWFALSAIWTKSYKAYT